MRIIIEEYKYAAADVKDVLRGVDALENVEGYILMNAVNQKDWGITIQKNV